jgi:hypothetical protein
MCLSNILGLSTARGKKLANIIGTYYVIQSDEIFTPIVCDDRAHTMCIVFNLKTAKLFPFHVVRHVICVDIQ